MPARHSRVGRHPQPTRHPTPYARYGRGSGSRLPMAGALKGLWTASSCGARAPALSPPRGDGLSRSPTSACTDIAECHVAAGHPCGNMAPSRHVATWRDCPTAACVWCVEMNAEITPRFTLRLTPSSRRDHAETTPQVRGNGGPEQYCVTDPRAIKVADTSIAAQCCDAGVCRRYDPQARALVPTSLISYVCTASGRMGVSGE